MSHRGFSGGSPGGWGGRERKQAGAAASFFNHAPSPLNASLQTNPQPQPRTKRGVGVTIVCPGPISTGSPDAPRGIYGPTGLQQTAAGAGAGSSKGKVTPERCAELIANATAHGVDEAWIAKHPVLLLGEGLGWVARGVCLMQLLGLGCRLSLTRVPICSVLHTHSGIIIHTHPRQPQSPAAYFMQYAPSLGWAVMKKVGPARARAVSSGRSGYDVAAILRDKGAAAAAGAGSSGSSKDAAAPGTG